MPPITVFPGRETAVTVAGNSAVNIMPAVADPNLASVTVAEWDAGEAIECSIRKVGLSGDIKNHDDQFLCDADSVEYAGTVKWSIDPIEIQAGDPQKPDTWLSSLQRGQTVYIGQRYGIPHGAAAEAGQVINQLTKAEVSNVGWKAVEANTDGSKFEKVISFAVKANHIDAKVVA
jgi:hypothetical protein